jgi:hypothetical protein
MGIVANKNKWEVWMPDHAQSATLVFCDNRHHSDLQHTFPQFEGKPFEAAH